MCVCCVCLGLQMVLSRSISVIMTNGCGRLHSEASLRGTSCTVVHYHWTWKVTYTFYYLEETLKQNIQPQGAIALQVQNWKGNRCRRSHIDGSTLCRCHWLKSCYKMYSQQHIIVSVLLVSGVVVKKYIPRVTTVKRKCKSDWVKL